MRNEDLVIGKKYKVDHERKGLFVVTLTSIDEVWVSGTLEEGRVKDRTGWIEVGESITFRERFTTMTEIKVPKAKTPTKRKIVW